ncbi:MAG: aldehyde dehydrogenase family protein [Methylovirgula sp.]
MMLKQATPAAAMPSSGATTPSQLDEIVAQLRAGAERFARISLDERIALARSMQRGYLRIARTSAEAATKAKGLPPEAAGDEWGSGPLIVVRGLRLIIESLEALRRTGNTPIGPVGRTKDGSLSIRVFPANVIDGLLFKDVTVDVHMAAGMSESELHEARASFYKRPNHKGRIALVLGAGNINSIPTWDVLTKMFVEGKVCVLKLNPVNAYLGPYLEEAFSDALAQNFLAIVHGAADEGTYLVQHNEVDEVHLTGSDRTYEAIVWGATEEERRQRRAERRPLVNKPVTAELGNVSPVVIVPGPYNEKELRYQAEEVAGAMALNAAFCCCTPRILVTAANWPQRGTFLDLLADALSRTPTRPAYYPGAVEKYRLATTGRNQVRRIGPAGNNILPWTIVTGLDPWNASDPAFHVEYFCPVLFETTLSASNTNEFILNAVDFCNTRLWGTLNATLIVHPTTQKDPALSGAVENAITWLKYGTVAVNAYPAMSFAFGTPPWGAHPGSTPVDIQSGTGFVHNARMLEGIEKVVMRHPLTTFPKPFYFPSHRTATRLMPKLVAVEENAGWLGVPGVVMTAMRC